MMALYLCFYHSFQQNFLLINNKLVGDSSRALTKNSGFLFSTSWSLSCAPTSGPTYVSIPTSTCAPAPAPVSTLTLIVSYISFSTSIPTRDSSLLLLTLTLVASCTFTLTLGNYIDKDFQKIIKLCMEILETVKTFAQRFKFRICITITR